MPPSPKVPLTIRRATPSDIPPLTNLINTAFHADHTTEIFLSPSHPHIDVTSPPTISSQLAQPSSSCAVFLATTASSSPENGSSNTELIAHFSLTRQPNATGTTIAWLGLLAVSIPYQNRGVGGQMVGYAEEFVRREWEGVGRVELAVVNTQTGLREWYLRRGYKETGERKPFYYEEAGEWEGVLRGGLEWIVLGKDV